jgi:hypothetical protein
MYLGNGEYVLETDAAWACEYLRQAELTRTQGHHQSMIAARGALKEQAIEILTRSTWGCWREGDDSIALKELSREVKKGLAAALRRYEE